MILASKKKTTFRFEFGFALICDAHDHSRKIATLMGRYFLWFHGERDLLDLRINGADHADQHPGGHRAEA